MAAKNPIMLTIVLKGNSMEVMNNERGINESDC